MICEEASAAIVALPHSESDAAHFVSKNGKTWYKNPPPSRRIRAHNVINYKQNKPRPSNKMVYDPLSIFRSLITEDIVRIIILATNHKANQVATTWNENNSTKPKQCKALTLKEFDSFMAIILYAGLTKSNSKPARELWNSSHAPIYKAALSHDRFVSITKFIRFENVNSRPQRLLTSKTAAIDDIWLMLQANLEAAYTPHSSVTVDGQLFPYHGRTHFTQYQLFPYHGRTHFTQYLPYKPAKYGIKVSHKL
ncbi:Transposase IS4 [Popillia japonica]|uniref:Transposase IS4 n=1 Tax=Popillia japonica TaxID=7064 RepID=A0AAW1L9Z1_POPJA